MGVEVKVGMRCSPDAILLQLTLRSPLDRLQPATGNTALVVSNLNAGFAASSNPLTALALTAPYSGYTAVSGSSGGFALASTPTVVTPGAQAAAPGTTESSSSASVIGGAVGGAVGGLFLIALVVVLVICCMKQQPQNSVSRPAAKGTVAPLAETSGGSAHAATTTPNPVVARAI